MQTPTLDAAQRQALLQRVQDILLRPLPTWQQIEHEDGSPQRIYLGYLIFLAAIPAVAGFIGTSLVGVGAFGIHVRVPLLQGLVGMVVGYALSLAMVYMLALIADVLAPKFQGQPDKANALKLVAYGATAGMLGGVFSALPALAMLGLLAALYSVYLIYTGAPVLMKVPQDRALAYTAVLLLCGILAGLVWGMVNAWMLPTGARWGSADQAASIQVPGTDIKIDASRVEEASRKLEKAQASGDTQAATQAAGEMLGAALGSKNLATFEAQQLRDLIPESLAGGRRSGIQAEKGNVMGIQFAQASAQYEWNGKSLDIGIKDIGAVPAMAMGMAAWAQTTAEREDDQEQERIYRKDNVAYKETTRKDGSYSEVSMLLPNGLLLEASGPVALSDIKTLLLSVAQKAGALRRPS